MSKVGVSGQSWGGTFSAQAILSRPDFYKVAISSAGAYDYSALYVAIKPISACQSTRIALNIEDILTRCPRTGRSRRHAPGRPVAGSLADHVWRQRRGVIA